MAPLGPDKKTPSSQKRALYCSFCGKSQHDVNTLVAGPTVFICDECVGMALDAIRERERDPANPSSEGSRLRYTIAISIDRPFQATEQNFLPAILAAIEANYPGCSVSIKTLETHAKGGKLQINFDSPVRLSAPEVVELSSEIEHLARQLKIAQERLIAEKAEKERYEVLYKELVDQVFPIVVTQLRKQGRLKERSIKTLLIFFADIAEFSKLSKEEREIKIDLVRLIGRSILSSEKGLYVNTWGDGLITAFDDPTQGLRGACKFVQHCQIDGIEVRVGVNWGSARITYNEITESLDIDGESVNIGARLEPLAESGEVLASDVVIGLEELDKSKFSFVSKQVELKKAVGDLKEGDKLPVYRVSYLPNA